MLMFDHLRKPIQEYNLYLFFNAFIAAKYDVFYVPKS